MSIVEVMSFDYVALLKLSVVYFDQQTVALLAICQSKLSFGGHLHLSHQKPRNQMGEKTQKTCLPAFRCYSNIQQPFFTLLMHFLSFLTGKDVRVPKKIILSSKQGAKYPIAGQNTQQSSV